jgi:hypothetical protein
MTSMDAPGRPALLRRGFALEYATLGWNVVGADGVQGLGNVLTADVGDAGQAVAQHDPGHGPVHRLGRRRPAVTKRERLRDQGCGAQVDAGERGLVVDT